jgi:DNA-binding Lrp family transcriptional regulator
MVKLKPKDFQLLYELMKNAKRSDRQIAKILGVSQPTVSRKRAMLEKEVIDSYTVVPKWKRLGYEILAITLVKASVRARTLASDEKVRDTYKRSMEWLKKQPNIIMGSGCRGMGMTGVIISLHKTYAEFDEFLNSHREHLGELLEEVQTIVVNLSGKAFYRPLNFKYLAEAR